MDVFEELGRGDAAYAFALSMHNAVANAIARFGAARAARALRAAASSSGELLGGFSLTEPHAGSDAAAITTQAVPVDDGWRVTGRKAWVSLAGEADVFVLVCRTGTERGTGDVLMLAVDARTDGVRVERLYDKAAGAFLPIGEVSYDEVHVPAYALLAPAGQGMRAALGAIDVARVDIAAISSGSPPRRSRSRSSTPAAARRSAARCSTCSRSSSRSPTSRPTSSRAACSTAPRRPRSTRAAAASLAAHAKRFCPDAALRAAIACSEVLGAYGLLHEYPLARFLAHAKMLQVVDGTTEVQRIVIARDLARR